MTSAQMMPLQTVSMPDAQTHPQTQPVWSAQGIQFSVVVTEGRPDETGLTMARALDDMGVPVDIILDSAIAYALERFRCAVLHPFQPVKLQ